MSQERLLNFEYNYWTGEHLHRYHIAQEHIGSNDTVLDIASGTGYGTCQLAMRTDITVTGGDISEQAVSGCMAKWIPTGHNVVFKVMDATQLPYAEGHFDRVVSFETIEHTTQYRQMLSELKRVLKQDGTLILSTPNQKITSPDGKIHNPYHTQEFSRAELENLLRSYFSEVKMHGQRNTRFDKKGITKGWQRFVVGCLSLRGVRRLPFRFKNKLSRLFAGIPLYPQPGDFKLETDTAIIDSRCPVLLAVCKK